MQTAELTADTWTLPGTSTTQVDLPTESDSHSTCGTWHCSGNLIDGKPVHYQQWCEKWRHQECPTCFGRRKKRFESEITRAFLDHGEEEFYVVILSKSDASSLAKLCSANESLYRRFPTSLYDYLIFQPFLDCPSSDLDWRDLDWETLADTPKGRRPSGKLGVEKSEKETGPVYKAEIMTIEYDAPAAIVKEAWKRAIEQTSDSNPHNPEQAEQCMNERLSYVAFWIADLGGHVIKAYYRNVMVPENSVLSWNNEETISELTELSYLDSPKKTDPGGIIIPF